MNVYSTETFKKEFKKLIKKNSYKNSLEESLINTLFKESSTPETLISSGNKVKGTVDFQFIKKRVKGSSGYRIYLLAVMTRDSIYLSYVHPKTGSKGMQSISTSYIEDLYLEVAESIEKNNLYELKTENKKIVFNKLVVTD